MNALGLVSWMLLDIYNAGGHCAAMRLGLLSVNSRLRRRCAGHDMICAKHRLSYAAHGLPLGNAAMGPSANLRMASTNFAQCSAIQSTRLRSAELLSASNHHACLSHSGAALSLLLSTLLARCRKQSKRWMPSGPGSLNMPWQSHLNMPWRNIDKQLCGGCRCAGHLLPQEAARMEPGVSSSTVKLLTQTAVSRLSLL